MSRWNPSRRRAPLLLAETIVLFSIIGLVGGGFILWKDLRPPKMPNLKEISTEDLAQVFLQDNYTRFSPEERDRLLAAFADRFRNVPEHEMQEWLATVGFNHSLRDRIERLAGIERRDWLILAARGYYQTSPKKKLRYLNRQIAFFAQQFPQAKKRSPKKSFYEHVQDEYRSHVRKVVFQMQEITTPYERAQTIEYTRDLLDRLEQVRKIHESRKRKMEPDRGAR
jgi:hypothetical protein